MCYAKIKQKHVYLHIGYVQSWVSPAHQEKAIQGDAERTLFRVFIFFISLSNFFWKKAYFHWNSIV